MKKSEILVVVKTYPEISVKYTETVCTAGILKESKRLIRLYPVRFRYLEGDLRFRKYQWIKAKITKATADTRPESYNIIESTIELGPVIDPGDDWHEREKWVLNSNHVYESVEDLLDSQGVEKSSLGIIKPKKIMKFYIENKSAAEIHSANLKKDGIMKQLDMFESKKDLEILPIRMILRFSCEDSRCKGHNMSILDWEFGQLFRRVKNAEDWEKKIENKVWEICSAEKEAYFILGNMASRQHIFCILGFFYPPKKRQSYLF